MNERKRRNLICALVLTGLLGLAPLWYQLQGMTHAKTSFPAMSEPISISADIQLPPRSTSSSVQSELKSSAKSLRALAEETDTPDAEIVAPGTHAAIRSFQIDATLFPSRLEPEVAQQLSLETPEPR